MRPTWVDVEWGGGNDTYRFHLKMAQIEELEEVAGEGIFRILASFQGHRKTYRYGTNVIGDPSIIEELVPEIAAKTATIKAIIRLGLIGGGMTTEAARKLMAKHFDNTPISEHIGIALTVVAAVAYGAPEDDDESVVPADPEMAAMAGSTSPPSTGPLQ